MWNGPVPYPCVAIKNLGEMSQDEAQPHTRLPRFQCHEDKSPQLLAAKTSGD